MTPVRTTHGADPALGTEVLRALDIAELACEPDSAFATDAPLGRVCNMLSRSGLSRTDLEHRYATRSIPELSIIVKDSRPVTIQFMIHDADGEDLLPGTRVSLARPRALAAIALTRTEMEAWLRDGDDEEAFIIAVRAMRGATPQVLGAMPDAGTDPSADTDRRLWFRHATAWSSARVGTSMGSGHVPELDPVLIAAMGEAMPPPVTSLQLEQDETGLKLIIGPPVVHASMRGTNVLSAMRDLNDATERMRRRT
jgi:hypothetical protein